MSNFPFRIGNKNVTKLAPNQFIAVANVTIFGWTISGIYIHTNGPIVKAKFTINVINPVNIITAPALGF